MNDVKVVTTVSVGGYARALIKHAFDNKLNLTNEALAAKVVAKFKEHDIEVKTSASCIAWYKNDMRKKGILPKGVVQSAKSIAVDLENIEL